MACRGQTRNPGRASEKRMRKKRATLREAVQAVSDKNTAYYSRKPLKPMTADQKRERMANKAKFRVAALSRSKLPRHPATWGRWLVLLSFQLPDHGLPSDDKRDLTDIIEADEKPMVKLWLDDGQSSTNRALFYSNFNYNDPRVKNSIMPLVRKSAEFVGGDPDNIDLSTFRKILDLWEMLFAYWDSFSRGYLNKETPFTFNPFYLVKAWDNSVVKFHKNWIDSQAEDLHTRTPSGRGIPQLEDSSKETLPSGRGLGYLASDEPKPQDNLPSGRGLGHLFDDTKE